MLDDITWIEINKNAKAEKIDPNVIAAIIQIESIGKHFSTDDTFAMRYEPRYKYFYNVKKFAKKLQCTPQTEKNGQKTSWGLMQIMGGVARERGFTGWFSQLCDPAIGIKYGVKHLSKFIVKYKNNEMDAIAAYNGGAARKRANGDYRNQKYVDMVLAKLAILRNEMH